MNLLLLDRHELDANAHARIAGRRAQHLRELLRVGVGDQVRAGILDGPVGTARILSLSGDHIDLEVACTEEAPPAQDVLLLAVPRPKALQRILEHAAALGFGQIVLFRSWRVEKSHLDSKVMEPAVQQEHLRLGLEQGQRTHMPRVQFFPLFKPFVEDHLLTLALPSHRFCAHPTATTATVELQLSRGEPFALALGPDGGFLPYEVEQLSQRGFLPIRLGPHPLRTDSALSVLHGQLDLLRQQG
jgi:RsmE family RNA methyltransferase